MYVNRSVVLKKPKMHISKNYVFEKYVELLKRKNVKTFNINHDDLVYL